jgi:hypothetical protein
MNANEILSSVNGAMENVAKVESQLFDVVKVQLHPNLEGFKSPLSYGVYKGTGGESLGVMGKDFVALQPKEFLGSIIDTVHECGANLDLNTLKFQEFKGGQQIAFTIDLPKLDFTNQAGFRDETHNKLTFSTSYDGTKSSTISLYTWRQVCSNGMMGWGLTSALKGKNTIGGKAKILTYCDEVVKIVTEADTYSQRLQGLDKIRINKNEVEAFKLRLLGYNAKSLASSDKAETKKLNILDRINSSIELEFSRTGETAFGLLQGITNYTNHEANNSKTITDEEYIRFGNGAKLNDMAQKLVFEMN